MNTLTVCSFRGKLIETRHEVAVAIQDCDGVLQAATGDPDLIVHVRSAAKPFQALPLVEDGVMEAFDISARELALACASHNSEQYQVATVSRWMQRCGLQEEQLVCGSHRPLANDLGFRRHDGTWEDVELAQPSRVASNCSGKHTGMLSLAKFHGWDEAGYAVDGHPVQERCRSVISSWFDVPSDDVRGAVDGCGVVSWAVPLRAIATGYARMANADGPMQTIVSAMMTHPELVAGKRRLCTALMKAYPGKVLAKVGAGGVYGVALLDRGLGVAIKVLDGDPKATAVALLAVLDSLGLDCRHSTLLSRFAKPVILNTNRQVVGHYSLTRSPTFAID